MKVGIKHVAILFVLAATILAACGPVASGSREFRVFVGPKLVDCEGAGPQKCMLVKENPDDDWTLFYDQIEGFDYEPGYEYELIVREEEVKDPPADASSLKWTLVEVVDKSKVEEPETGEGLEGPRWLLDSYASSEGKTANVLPDIEITVVFQEGMARGTAGCNNYFGEYRVDGQGLIIGPVGMTEMYCMPDEVMAQESDYLAALQSAAAYEIAGDKLQIKNSAGQIVLTFSNLEASTQTAPLTGTLWQLTGYGGDQDTFASVINGTEITAMFGEDGKLSGSAGCNNYATNYELDGNQLAIGPAAVTMMMCVEPEGVMEQESAYLAALESAAALEVKGNQLILNNAEGQTVAAYAAVEPTPLTDTLWQLTAYNNGKGGFASVLLDTEITATFGEDGSLGGSAGCNNYTTSYEIDGDKIAIGPVASTMMMCQMPEGVMEQEAAYLRALEEAETFKIEGDQLTLFNAEGQRVATYVVREPMSLTGTTWEVSRYINDTNGFTSVLLDTEITAVFDEEGKVSGLAGCNSYAATYEIDGNQIAIGPAALTRMMCGSPEGIMEQETLYLAALESATSYEIAGDELELYDSEGTRAVRYVPREEAVGLDEDTLMNMEYKSEWTQSGTAPLTNGAYSEQAAPGSATETAIVLLPEYTAYGQLDGQPAAAVVLVTNPGGSGTFYDLAVVVMQGGQPVNVATTSLGDRVDISSVIIEQNQIVVDMVVQGPDDPMCCPSQRVLNTYALQGDQLVETGSRVIGSKSDEGLDIAGTLWKWEKFLESNDNTILVDAPDRYTIQFQPDGTVQILADCNSVGGIYTVNGNQLTIELGPSTMAACPPGSLDQEYLGLLQDVVSYIMDGENLVLLIKYDSGSMIFAPGE